MDFFVERDDTGMPRRLVWIPPEHRPSPPTKPPVGTFRVRLGSGALTEPIPVDAEREVVEAAVRAAQEVARG